MANRCQAFAVSTKDQCKNNSLPKFKYCRHHSDIWPNLVSLTIGALLSLLAAVTYNKIITSDELKELQNAKKEIAEIVTENEKLRKLIKLAENRITSRDIQLWLHVIVAGPEKTEVSKTLASNKRLYGSIDGHDFVVDLSPHIAPERISRRSHISFKYRFMSTSLKFLNLNDDLYIHQLNGRILKLDCSSKKIGLNNVTGSCYVTIFIRDIRNIWRSSINEIFEEKIEF